jgi:RNA polymerase sigma factor (sigma-70 family)
MDASATPDERLLGRYARGDVAAFETLYARYELPLWRFALRLCQERGAAEEVTQEAWFTVCREAANIPQQVRFPAWLFTIARNRIIDRYRTRHPHLSLDAAAVAGGEPLAAQIADERTASPTAQVEQLQQGQAILAALEHLPLLQREAFVMQAEADMSVAEIAAATGTSAETVKSRLRYARDKLRQLLQDQA